MNMVTQMLDDADVATLLAFVDEFDAAPIVFQASQASSPSPSSSSSVSSRSPGAADSLGSSSEPDVLTGDTSSWIDVKAASTTAPAPEQKKKKKRSPASSSTALQRRKRAEIAALKELAVELEAQVADLKRLRTGSPSRATVHAMGPVRKPGASPSVWQELAALQSRERHRAEVTNRKLKATLSDQQQTNEALRAMLSKRSVLHGLEAIMDAEPVFRSPVVLDCAPDTLGMLEKQVQAMYISMDRRQPPVAPPASVSSTTEALSLKSQGHTIQVVTTTPMNCSVEEAADILWREMGVKREIPDKSYSFFARPDEHALEKNFVMLIRDTSSNFQINGVQFMRKYTEADRVVIVRTDLMLLPTSGLRFRDRVWTTISRVGSGPDESSVVEARYQLNAEVEDGLAASPDDLSYVQQYLMQRLSSNSRMYEQFLQSTLLAENTRRRAVQEVV